MFSHVDNYRLPKNMETIEVKADIHGEGEVNPGRKVRKEETTGGFFPQCFVKPIENIMLSMIFVYIYIYDIYIYIYI